MLKVSFAMCACIVVFSWGEAVTCLILIRFLFLLNKPVGLEITYFDFELDFFRWALIGLTLWVTAASIIRRTKVKNSRRSSTFYLSVLISIALFLFLTFSVSSSVAFYILFETCLIPILIIILGWGYQPERSQAGLYLLFYTIFGSLPLLIIVLRCRNLIGSRYLFIMRASISGLISALCFSLAFLVKFPMYRAHLWLLKAHVEAPVAGSMLLAGVLLKLGGFGLVRIFYFLDYNFLVIKELITSIRLWGGLLISLNCLRHMDIKVLIASSSVVHIRACVAALFILRDWRVKGCLLIILAHGLCSSGLFSLANIVYERTGRRRIVIAKGLLNLTPTMALCWFLLLTANIAAPPTINLRREIMLLTSLVSWNLITVAPLIVLGFFRAAYRLYLFSISQHGAFNKTKRTLNNRRLLEYLIVFMHWIPLNSLILVLIFMFCFNSLNKTLFCGNRDTACLKHWDSKLIDLNFFLLWLQH
jgi:NADH-ubiquinone oxidoreductase chain 4